MPEVKINGQSYELQRLEIELPDFELVSWLSQQALYPKVYWRERETGVERAALGSLLALSEVPQISHPGIRFYGGVGFSPVRKEKRWNGFPQTAFWLPRFDVVRENGRNRMVIHALGEELSAAVMRELIFARNTATEALQPILESRREFVTSVQWKEMVAEALQRIERGEIEKLVLARTEELHFKGALSPWQMVKRLQGKAERATLYCFQLHPQASFLGATPEKLYTRQGQEICTEALAGTRKRGQTEAEDRALEQELLENPKERREFALVKQFLDLALLPLCEGMCWDLHDRVLKTPNVQHIYNRLRAQLKGGISDERLLQVLHPTPALGGAPQQKALLLLQAIEPFDRGWYGAPLGWVASDSADMAIGIRSALLRGHVLHLFAGAGIVAGSQAEKEWEETEQKMRVILYGCGLSQ